MQEIPVRSVSWEDFLEKEMATHTSIFAWKIPWPKETGRLQSTGSQKNWTQQLNNSNSFSNSFPIRLLQNIEQCSLCYTVGPGWLSVLNIAVYTCQPPTSVTSVTIIVLKNIVFITYLQTWFVTKVASHRNGGKKDGLFNEGSVTRGYPYGIKNKMRHVISSQISIPGGFKT